MRYRISGDTYQVKDNLKSCGCTWVAEKKEWRTPYLEKEEPLYEKIKNLCKFAKVSMVPERLSKECQKIQSILKKNGK